MVAVHAPPDTTTPEDQERIRWRRPPGTRTLDSNAITRTAWDGTGDRPDLLLLVQLWVGLLGLIVFGDISVVIKTIICPERFGKVMEKNFYFHFYGSRMICRIILMDGC